MKLADYSSVFVRVADARRDDELPDDVPVSQVVSTLKASSLIDLIDSLHLSNLGFIAGPCIQCSSLPSLIGGG